LLGWRQAWRGDVFVDGRPLSQAHLQRLRSETVWVDPAVNLWNRTLLYNLRYGAPDDEDFALGEAIEAADLHTVVDSLPDGLQTRLGEGGALVSGGEGQRVRLGRGLNREGARLVILDEPFRGLDREGRRRLLAGCRKWWSKATLLFVSHDVSACLDMDRVVVMENGRIVENDSPRVLADRRDSRFAAWLQAEREVLQTTWGGPNWQRLRLQDGRLQVVEKNGGRP
jgi:ATP-binding cassette subfamily B protein